MNSQDLNNLQEAYSHVYSVDEETAPGVKPYKPREPNPLPQAKPLSGKKGDGSGYGADKKFTQDTDRASFKPGVDVPAVKKFGRISRAIPHGIGAHANKVQSRVSTITRKDPGAPTSQKLPPEEKKKPSREIVRKPKNEEFDLYDIILSHLLDEGYAETVEAAEAIMVNMSEDWRDSICEEEYINEISVALKRRAAAASAVKADKAHSDFYKSDTPSFTRPSEKYREMKMNKAAAQHQRLTKAAYPKG